MTDEKSPLIKALPPESDYLTYLTIVEYNLSVDALPTLHQVLQDEKLTTNIGWDLVHLLLPYLPDAEQCLEDISRLGNPREVILKVTECLRLIEYDETEELNDEANMSTSAIDGDARSRADSSTYPLKTAPTTAGAGMAGSSQAIEPPPSLPLEVNQFIALLNMLAILHPRIKTKYPSRFLSTSLQAVLASFSNTVSHREEMILSIVGLINAISGTKRPALPNRRSSGMLSTSSKTKQTTPAGDPEALNSGEIDAGEPELQLKLLQSFVTHVLEEYMLNLDSGDDDVPGLAWCSRLMERIHPERNIPQTETFNGRFAQEQKLHRRLDAIGQLVTVSRDLRLADDDLLHAALAIENIPDVHGHDEDDPPNSPEDIPLSRLGSLLLYTSRRVSVVLYDSSLQSIAQNLVIFPDHRDIIGNCLSPAAKGTGTLGTEPDALIDAVLAIGILCLESDAIGEPETDDEFNEYLQITALLSSNCPSPVLRGHAHYVTSTVLRSHPDDNLRLGFIRDTLEHCPFENLKVSAVGWIKGETIEANPPNTADEHAHSEGEAQQTCIFGTPLALDTLSPYLFPSLEMDLITAPVREAYVTFRTNLSFYLASLNFLYLLLCARHLHYSLSIQGLWTNNDISGSFLQPLRDASVRYSQALGENGDLKSESGSPEVFAELNVLNETIERLTRAATLLNE